MGYDAMIKRPENANQKLFAYKKMFPFKNDFSLFRDIFFVSDVRKFKENISEVIKINQSSNQIVNKIINRFTILQIYKFTKYKNQKMFKNFGTFGHFFYTLSNVKKNCLTKQK